MLFRSLIKKDDRWNITGLNNLADNLLNRNSHELNSFYNNKKTVIEQKIINIELPARGDYCMTIFCQLKIR